MLKPNILKLLNEQIALEDYSANLYLAMSSWCGHQKLSGSARFLEAHSDKNDTINVQYAQNTQAQIEKFTLSDGNYLTSNDINVIIQSMNAYATDHGMSITSLDTVKNNQALMNIVAGAWHQ